MNTVQTIEQLLRRGPRTSAELAAVAGVNSTTVTRAIANLPAAIQMGRARAARYGLAEGLRGLPAQPHPVYRVGGDGAVMHIGNLAAIVGGGFWYEDREAPERSSGFDSLPWFLQDLRPQGFLGRATVRHFATRGWPRDLAVWSERDVLASILHSAAHDHIGNLLVGEQARIAYEISRHPLTTGLPHDARSRIQRYREMVQRMGDDAVAGTSVHGEQPKFCAAVSLPDSSSIRHVLVKFSAPVSTEAGQRWSDLLLMEQRCPDVVRTELRITAATATWHSDGERAYLEVDRFDRTVDGGRLGVISFASLDAEFSGLGEHWTQVAQQLAADGHLAPDAAHTSETLEFFAVLTGNNDRHLGNLSAHFSGIQPMTLTPIYDFLPMRYAPNALGMNSEPLALRDFRVLPGSTLDIDVRRRAAAAARIFWEGCSADPRLSAPMRQLCARNAEAVAQFAPDEAA